MSKDEAEKLTKVGPLRIVRNRKQDTNRTLCVIDDKVYEEMVSQGFERKERRALDYNDFQVKRYIMDNRNLSKNRERRHLMIKLPKILSGGKVDEQLSQHMAELVKFNIVPEKSYRIVIPFKDREGDEHIGHSIIVFNDDVLIWDIAMTHETLRESLWSNRENKPMTGLNRWRQCFWSLITDSSQIRMSPADRNRVGRGEHREWDRNRGGREWDRNRGRRGENREWDRNRINGESRRGNRDNRDRRPNHRPNPRRDRKTDINTVTIPQQPHFIPGQFGREIAYAPLPLVGQHVPNHSIQYVTQPVSVRHQLAVAGQEQHHFSHQPSSNPQISYPQTPSSTSLPTTSQSSTSLPPVSTPLTVNRQTISTSNLPT